MRTLFIAAASALFFAAIVTELSIRLWPDNYVALLVIAFIALFVSGMLNLKLAGLLGAARQAARPRRGGHSQRAGAEGREQRGRGRDKSSNGRRQKGGDAGEKGRVDRQAQPRPAEPPPEGPRETGTVKWFNRNKGFGFVIRESGQEIFVHQRSIRMTGEGDNRRRPNLKDGQSVSFVVAEREKGLQAEDVVPDESS